MSGFNESKDGPETKESLLNEHSSFQKSSSSTYEADFASMLNLDENPFQLPDDDQVFLIVSNFFVCLLLLRMLYILTFISSLSLSLPPPSTA